MRKVVIVCAGVVWTIAFLGPAAGAKPGHEDPTVAVISISGPGLDGPVLLSGDPVWRILYLTTFRGFGIASAEQPTAEDLGPGFDASYRFVLRKGDVQTLRQTLYPCAADGRVWAFTPSGQDYVLQRHRISTLVQTGWWHSVKLVRVLDAYGLGAACDRSDAGAAASIGLPGPGSLAGLWVGLGGILVLVGIGALEAWASRTGRPARA